MFHYLTAELSEKIYAL